MVRQMLFPDDPPTPWYKLNKRPLSYFFIPAGRASEQGGELKLAKPIWGVDAFFANGAVVGDIGCGHGFASREIARTFRKRGVHVIGVDSALGKTIPLPENESNLEFYPDDWDQMSHIADNTFDRIIGAETFGRWTNNPSVTISTLRRVTKPGAVLRATFGKFLAGSLSFFEQLSQAGWDVYVPSGSLTVLAVRPIPSS